MSELKQITTILKQHNRELRQLGVESLAVFGSIVREEQNLESDVDFLVKFSDSQQSYANLYNLYVFLRNVTGRDVDVVTEKGISKYMRPYIEKELRYVDF